MGPFSEKIQSKRRATLQLILANPKLSADMKRIWKQKLNQLAVDEDEYNERVKKLYENIQPWKTF
jgi:hypothetical protein